MGTSKRKERELREREARILEVARAMLIEDGYHGLNIDRIAAELEYAKGTIYNHFANKEDIISALAIQTSEKRAEMFQRAATFRGQTRERLLAIGIAAELFIRLYPDHFCVEQIIRSESVRQKATEMRREVMRSCETRCVSTVGGIVRDAIAHGDLELPKGAAPEDIVFGLWSLNFGAYSIITSSDSLPDIGIRDPIAAVHLNINTLLDGYRWRPLSSEYDYDLSFKRVASEVFPDEYRQAKAG